MSRSNFVQCQLAAPLTAAATAAEIKVGAAFAAPPSDGGLLVLSDSLGQPTAFEVVRYTSCVGPNNGVYQLNGLQRGLEGTAARAWDTDHFVYQSLTVGDLDAIISNLQNQINGKAPLASPALTGTPTAPTAPSGTNTTQIATTAFVQAEIANDAPTKTGTGASGTWGISVTGNAATATKLATACSIALSGDVTGSASFDGSTNISVTATVADDSHNHIIANVDGLQTALDGKAAAGHTHAISEVSGLQAALDAANGLAQGAIDQDPNTTGSHAILSRHANTPDASHYWHITTTFYSTISGTANRGQIAVQYSVGNQVYARSSYSGTWTPWVRLDNGALGTAATKNITISTAAPSGGVDGDLWIQY